MKLTRKKGETRGRKAGVPVGPYSLRHLLTCKMCGRQFLATRQGVKSGSPLCRQALHRWVQKFGFEPEQPPGTTASGKPLRGCSIAERIAGKTT